MTSTSIDAFQASLRGELMTPESAGYHEARAVWNGMINRSPALIARCLGTADVIAGVNFARNEGLDLCIKGGGHNISGLAVSDGSLMLDMSLMKGVWVDPAARRAQAQAGCTLGEVDRETQIHGMAAVLGFVSNTGIAGLTLGGGFGYLSRKYGWTSDTVRSMNVVTAEGKLVRANETENADLFWGLRGGGGNFGVVTNFEYSLYPVGPEIMAGAIAWKAEDAAGVLEMYRELVADAPPELNCPIILRKAPPAPWISPNAHGKPVVVVVFCHTGSLEDGRKAAASVKAFGNPVGDVIQPRPYITQQSLIDATQPDGRRYYWKSEYLPGLDPAMLPKLVDHLDTMPSPHSAVLLFPLDGALSDLPEDHSAVGNRQTGMVVNIAGSWESASDDEANVAWARTAWEDFRPFSTGGTYINFLTEEEGDDRIQDALGSNLDRLRDVKTAWDPENLFRVNKNIKPR